MNETLYEVIGTILIFVYIIAGIIVSVLVDHELNPGNFDYSNKPIPEGTTPYEAWMAIGNDAPAHDFTVVFSFFIWWFIMDVWAIMWLLKFIGKKICKP